MHLLRRAGRQRGIETEAHTLRTALQTHDLEQPAPLAEAYGAAVQAQVQVIAALSQQIASMEHQLTAQFEAHPDAEILRSLPGLGPVLGARVLAEFGDAPGRYADSKARKCYAGTAPVTRISGHKRTVLRRASGNRQLAATCSWWAFSSLTKSPGAAVYYRLQRSRGKTHQQALRAVANRWVGILHGCLRDRLSYDETIAWPDLTTIMPAEPAAPLENPAKSSGGPLGSTGSLRVSA